MHSIFSDSILVVLKILNSNIPFFKCLYLQTQETGKEYHEKVFSTCTSVMNLIQVRNLILLLAVWLVPSQWFDTMLVMMKTSTS